MSPSLSGLVVICAPDQLREAAIALSCCPADRFTPLMVIAPPPLPEAQYAALYASYVEARDRRDILVGTSMASPAESETLTAAKAAVDALSQQLVPFRLWWRRLLLLSETFRHHPPRHAICLFQPEASALDLIDAIPMSRIGERRTPLLPAETERIDLAGVPLAELPERAWAACGRDVPMPPGIWPAADDAASWYEALSLALGHGLPIHGEQALALTAPPDGGGGDAVLVEMRAQADGLTGVHYAHLVGAKLVFVPEPDMANVESALRAMAAPEGSKLFQGLQRLFTKLIESPDVRAAFDRIEAAVNKCVSNAAVAAVGERHLTAFTVGVPLHFIRRRGVDWAAKPIGHVIGDPLLILLAEFLPRPPQPFGYSLIFDPDFFSTDETADALAILKQRPALPLLLTKQGAANLNLQFLSAALPLEMIYFNTHGSDREIVLADEALPFWKLTRHNLVSRPVVFNNSCLSWIGVGRAFLGAGAGSYIGTLWPVNAEDAAHFSRIVLDRITKEAWPIARALRDTDVDDATARAYIFVGTCRACLPGTVEPADRRAALTVGINLMLDALSTSLKQTPNGPPMTFVEPMREMLMQQMDRLIALLDQHWPDPLDARAELAVDRASLLVRMAEQGAGSGQAAETALRDAQAMLARIAMPSEIEARLMLAFGRFATATGQSDQAIEWLERAVTLTPDAPAYSALSDALRAQGCYADALSASRRALAVVRDPSQRLMLIGRVGQLQRRLQDFSAALATAREGLALATAQDNLLERARFKGDEARALLALERFGEAVATAEQYGNLARVAFNDAETMAAAGVLTQALIGTGRLDEADLLAERSIAMAQAGAEEARFHLDRATIANERGLLARAANQALTAADRFAGADDGPGVRYSVRLATETFARLIAQEESDGARTAILAAIKADFDAIPKTAQQQFRTNLRTLASRVSSLEP